MTPGLPEILKRATGMAELDCRYTWKSSPPRPSVEPHWGTVPKLGCLAERNAEILRPDQIGTQVRFQDSDGVHRTPEIGDSGVSKKLRERVSGAEQGDKLLCSLSTRCRSEKGKEKRSNFKN